MVQGGVGSWVLIFALAIGGGAHCKGKVPEVLRHVVFALGEVLDAAIAGKNVGCDDRQWISRPKNPQGTACRHFVRAYG